MSAPTIELPGVATDGALRQVENPWVILVKDVTKTYGVADLVVHALGGVSLAVERGDSLAIMGASGSGKSTLMNILGCLDEPTSGRYLLDGVDVSKLQDFQLAEIRNHKVGFVFQSFNLVPRTTALANVELPMVYGGVKRAEREERARAALEVVGLGDRCNHLPSELSGGQQQRVAIARAISTDPAIILADEPTGALDSTSTGQVLDIFDRLHDEGRTVILITHEHDVAARARRVIHLRDGLIVDDEISGPASIVNGPWR